MDASTALSRYRPRLTSYIPQEPTPKQRAFLLLPHREAFFGGAAAGGKSSAMLMAALQYVDVPGYAALILRKTLVDAKQPSSILFRAREWLTPTDAIFRSDENRWYFPSGATLTFGKCSQTGDAFAYAGSEFQAILFDELTHFNQADFEFITSRLRRPRCPKHAPRDEPSCPTCQVYGQLSKVPLRIRSASNPGGPGHLWVKRRYKIEKIEGKRTPKGRQLYAGTDPAKPHIPSFIDDNPYLDQESYVDQLSAINDPVTREQLLSGDWGISAEGRFKLDWLRRYRQNGSWFELIGAGTFHERQAVTFLMIDPAASRTQTPGREQITKRQASYTVVSAWSMVAGHLLLRYVERHQKEVPETKHAIRRALQRFPTAAFVGMELSTMSQHLFQLLAVEGFNMRAFSPYTGDKIARSVEATNRMESGRLWAPADSSQWLREWEDEIFTWTGDPQETDDQVDVTSYAAMYAGQFALGNRIVSAGNAPSVE